MIICFLFIYTANFTISGSTKRSYELTGAPASAVTKKKNYTRSTCVFYLQIFLYILI